MSSGILIEILWWDDDIVELRFIANNLRYSGEATTYVSHDALREMRHGLQGFPKSKTDSREFIFGSVDGQYSGGGARLEFCTIDPQGHCQVHVQLRTEQQTSPVHATETVSMYIPIEAAGVDRFIENLSDESLKQGKKYELQMTT